MGKVAWASEGALGLEAIARKQQRQSTGRSVLLLIAMPLFQKTEGPMPMEHHILATKEHDHCHMKDFKALMSY